MNVTKPRSSLLVSTRLSLNIGAGCEPRSDYEHHSHRQKKEVDMATQFQSGEIVRLKSGGPAMVVRNSNVSFSVPWAEDTVETIWFGRAHKNYSGQFPVSALVLVDWPDGPRS